jgi:DNA-binding XRE family transcriptional regulator
MVNSDKEIRRVVYQGLRMSKEKLNRIRASLGLSQQALAELAGISKPTMIDAEKNRPIQLLTAYAILNAVNGLRKERGWSELTIDSIEWNVRE